MQYQPTKDNHGVIAAICIMIICIIIIDVFFVIVYLIERRKTKNTSKINITKLNDNV